MPPCLVNPSILESESPRSLNPRCAAGGREAITIYLYDIGNSSVWLILEEPQNAAKPKDFTLSPTKTKYFARRNGLPDVLVRTGRRVKNTWFLCGPALSEPRKKRVLCLGLMLGLSGAFWGSFWPPGALLGPLLRGPSLGRFLALACSDGSWAWRLLERS